MNFWKKDHSYKIWQVLVFATQKVLLKWGNLQILYCDISKTKSCQILVPRKKIGKKKYVKFFAQGSCVQTKSGVAEIKRNFTNFAGWFQKKNLLLITSIAPMEKRPCKKIWILEEKKRTCRKFWICKSQKNEAFFQVF